MKTLSKSDFILARSCVKKLYYKENGFKMNTMDNEYMKYLAEGGYLIGKYAQLMYPEGILIDSLDKEQAINETNQQLQKDDVVLFEAAIENDNVYFRADILIKNGKTIRLLEVKAKSYDPTEKIKQSEFGQYIEDALFQAISLEEVFPDCEINVGLLLPDKSKRIKIDHLHKYFSVYTDNNGRLRAEPTFELGSKIHQNMVDDNFLSILPLESYLNTQRESLKQVIQSLSALYVNDRFEMVDVEINKDCKKCEFNLGENEDGYSQCWNDLGEVKPHIFDLYQAGKLKEDGLNQLITTRRVNLLDVPVDMISKKNGELGAYGERRLIQIENTRNNSEWFDANVLKEATDLPFPLFFIDFETATSALPPYDGMRPYEMIAFQWSCHIVRGLDKPLEHYEFIHTESEFPNFKFAESLMKLVGNNQNLFMWATHENTTLRTILEQMDTYDYSNPDLRAWLEWIVKMDKGDSGIFMDMNKVTLNGYFHPDMKGRTSIKVTLPAIWKNNPYLHKNDWFKDYVAYDEAGKIQSPYATLANHIDILEEADVVNEGTGAMRAYFEMMFGQFSSDSDIKESWKQSLLNYCKLDTLSMVIIWYHWEQIIRSL